MRGESAISDSESRLPRSIAPLGYRNFLLYFVGYAATNTGRWMELTGVVWLAYQLTSSPVLLGVLGIARAAPVIVLSPIGGVVADRVDQRRLLVTTQALGFAASLALGILILTGRVELWHVYAQVVVQASITAFDAAGRQAMFPRLVPKARLSEAVTLSVVAARSSKLIGPAVGGLAIAAWGEASPFLLNALTFVSLITAVTWMRGVKPRTLREGSTFRGELFDGMGYLLRAPVLSGLLQLELVFGIFQLNPVIIAIIGRQVFGVGPEGLGGMLSAPALGSILGIAGLLIVGQPSRSGRFVVICVLLYAVGLVALAAAGAYLVALGVLVCIGVVDALAAVTRQSVMQMAAPGRMRGRVMANVGMVTRGTSPLAEAQSGGLAGLLGPQLALVSAAFALATAATLTGRANRSLWRFSRADSEPEPMVSPAAIAVVPEGE